jgi:hypothetical protein
MPLQRERLGLIGGQIGLPFFYFQPGIELFFKRAGPIPLFMAARMAAHRAAYRRADQDPHEQMIAEGSKRDSQRKISGCAKKMIERSKKGCEKHAEKRAYS